ncbi:MAG: glycoside hydrolase family 15 protein [Deltaproteobacteria bacterium]|nr:glycoside hydrolase family 15 protein [Deltaproteobacteria bacterium]
MTRGEPSDASEHDRRIPARQVAPQAAIEDHAVIGDGRSAALIARDGTIDWLCWPRFDSAPVFGALLDDARGGRFAVRPVGFAGARREYVDGTNVLRTRHAAAGGDVVVTDLLPVATGEDHARTLLPEHELLRVIECVAGSVEVRVLFDPRPSFGRPRALRAEGGVVRAEQGAEVWILRGASGWRARAAGGIETTIRLRAGERSVLSLVYARRDPAILTPLRDAALARADATVRWWQTWSSRLRYSGPDRDAVVRSALVLKLLCFGPSGAVVAAPTTALPERLGGDLNWDYRFCWLRDAALTVRALFGLGFEEEADAFVDWMLHATRLTRPELRVLYDVFGRIPRRERERTSLVGYAGSRPVRLGNAAAEQFQLDVYGEVIDAAARACREGRHPDPETARMLRQFGEFVCRNWQRPDDGIWEGRGRQRHHVHSRVLCWVALDRLLMLDARGDVPLRRDMREKFLTNREAIRHEVQARGWSSAKASYVQTLDGDELDASLLLLSWYGFEPPASARMRSTFAALDRALGVGNGLLRRNRDYDEGAFGICSFWAVEHLARGGGTLEQARTRFDALLSYANDVGLFAEEIDPATGRALGNFPQAFTHIGLVNAALSIEQRERADAAARRSRASAEPPRPERGLEGR